MRSKRRRGKSIQCLVASAPRTTRKRIWGITTQIMVKLLEGFHSISEKHQLSRRNNRYREIKLHNLPVVDWQPFTELNVYRILFASPLPTKKKEQTDTSKADFQKRLGVRVTQRFSCPPAVEFVTRALHHRTAPYCFFQNKHAMHKIDSLKNAGGQRTNPFDRFSSRPPPQAALTMTNGPLDRPIFSWPVARRDLTVLRVVEIRRLRCTWVSKWSKQGRGRACI